MRIIPVKDFWVRPDPVPIKAREFSFGYSDQGGREYRYKVEVKGDDLELFHQMAFKILDAKKKRALPWNLVGALKGKVKIINMDTNTMQTELELKAFHIAGRFLNKQKMNFSST